MKFKWYRDTSNYCLFYIPFEVVTFWENILGTLTLYMTFIDRNSNISIEERLY